MRKKTVLLSQEKYATWYTAISTTRHVRKARLNPLLMNFVGSATKSKWKCTTCTATKYKTADTDRLVPVARTGFADAISNLWSPSARYPVSASKPPRSNSRHSSTGHLFLHYAECFRHNASARSFHSFPIQPGKSEKPDFHDPVGIRLYVCGSGTSTVLISYKAEAIQAAAEASR